jgi:hypothetical protein
MANGSSIFDIMSLVYTTESGEKANSNGSVPRIIYWKRSFFRKGLSNFWNARLYVVRRTSKVLRPVKYLQRGAMFEWENRLFD